MATGVPTKEEDVSIWSTHHVIEPPERDQYGREGDELNDMPCYRKVNLAAPYIEVAVSGMSPLVRVQTSEHGADVEVYLSVDECRQLADALSSVIQ
jgi:hypothetical protein